MSLPGTGGLPAQRPDQITIPMPQGIQAGSSPGIVFARQVIVFGTGEGVFVYPQGTTPGLGNPPVAWIVAPGVTADPYGNPVTAVIGAGTTGGPDVVIDQYGDVTSTASDGSMLAIQPAADLPFALTSLLSGIMDGAFTITTADANETQSGVVADIVLGSGSTAQMGTLITSPYGTTGMGLLLLAENDGSTNTASALFGTVTTQGGSLTFQPVLFLAPYAMLVYGGGGTLTVVTKTSGSGTISGLPATVKAETWGAGASTAGVSGGASALGGSGSGGYSQEPALATSGSVTYSVPASANSPGGTPADCTITGSAVTVTAHSGTAGTGTGYGAGAAASSNTIAYAGARGGNPSFADPGGGGGGGGAAGPGGAGNHGDAGAPYAGGAGGAGAAGGGDGGQGGTPTGNGGPGASPGGGGGGGSTNADGAIGGHGQVRVTYTSGTPPVLLSVASAAGSDPFGSSYPAGLNYQGTTSVPAVVTTDSWHSMTLLNGWSAGSNYARYRLTPDGRVQIEGYISGGTIANGTAIWDIPAGYAPSHNMILPLMVISSNAGGAAAEDSPYLLVNAAGPSLEVFTITTQNAASIAFATEYTII
jgi:hypothetical protein